MRKVLTSIIMSSLLLISIQAHALPISPSTGAILDGTDYTGNQNSTSVITAQISAYLGATATELYKQNAGANGTEEGILKANYSTSFNADLSGATITHTGGTFVDNPAYLLVKDGNNSPWWYLFDLTSLSWNGTETLNLTGFWPQQGSISHVSLYGTEGNTPPVPEPGTIILLGAGLLGLGLYGRKRAKK